MPCSSGEKLKRFCLPAYDKKEIQKVANFILENFDLFAQGASDIGTLPITGEKLGKIFIKKYEKTWAGNQTSNLVDCALVQREKQEDFLHHVNQQGLLKWESCGQSARIYKKYPDFCRFITSSGLLSQIKITRDCFQELDGEPAVKVSGEWMKWSAFQNTFKWEFSKRYKEKFVVHKTEHQVYTYLDNGKGLQPHHPFLSDHTPLSVLNDEDYTKVLQKAHEFVRPEEKDLSPEERQERNEERTFILQLVSSHLEGIDMRFTNLVIKPKHPYIRLVMGRDNPDLQTRRGEVYEVGYGWKSEVKIPLVTVQGRFRSPDVWEYKKVKEKIVTNIAVTAEEARHFADYVAEYHRSEVNLGNPIGFHLFNQNCSTFVRAALAAANIYVPTELTLKKLWSEILPLWIHDMNAGIIEFGKDCVDLGKRMIEAFPSFIKTPMQKFASKAYRLAKKLVEACAAICMLPFKLVLGDASGRGGRAFAPPGQPPEHVEPNLKKFRRWFMLSNYSLNLPGLLQRWQKEQASTVIYRDPVRLAIVP